MVKKELKMVQYYGMFSDAGNKRVEQIVNFARDKHMTWICAYGLLQQLAKKKGFEEATDTAVREIVYDALGFTSDFYV
jgi:hypothetical protein